jgi:hypothetical protein
MQNGVDCGLFTPNVHNREERAFSTTDRPRVCGGSDRLALVGQLAENVIAVQ